jgi:hypothetical protein
MGSLTLGYLILALAIFVTGLLIISPIRQLDLPIRRIREIRPNGVNDILKAANNGWEDVLRELGPVKSLFQAARKKTRPVIGLDDWSYLDATERMHHVGKVLASICGTLSQSLTSIYLVQASDDLRGHLVGEVDGLKTETIETISDSLDDLFKGVRERKASLLYDALTRLNFTSRENLGAQSLCDNSKNRPYSREFNQELIALVREHFVLGTYDALDKFIYKWSSMSIQKKDIYVYALVTFLDEYQSELGPLSKSLRKTKQFMTTNTAKEEALIISEGLKKFGIAYYKKDPLSQFRELTKLIHTFNQ